jgi:putative transcriptional regulator
MEIMTPGAVRLRLPEILTSKGMTQTECAKQTGLSRNAVSKLCNNPSQISMETIDVLCKALGIEPADLFTYSPENKEIWSQ